MTGKFTLTLFDPQEIGLEEGLGAIGEGLCGWGSPVTTYGTRRAVGRQALQRFFVILHLATKESEGLE